MLLVALKKNSIVSLMTIVSCVSKHICRYMYLSRCLLIRFLAPCLEMSMKSYSELPTLLARATSGVGMLISLEEAFTTRGINEMDADIVPTLRASLGGLGVIP